MATLDLPEIMAPIGGAIIVIAVLYAIGWAGYCVNSIARAADALERIADALEDDDEEVSND